jgi:hypothetical protein
MEFELNATIERLLECWCDRREYGALAAVLPAWTANNGLTDGWIALRDALRHVYAACTHLPSDERDVMKRCIVAIDAAMRNHE